MGDQPLSPNAQKIAELGRQVISKAQREAASKMVSERLALETQTFTVTISREQFEKLKWLANSQSISATSALEKAIETEYYMKQQTSQGKRVLVQSAN
jgi:hypothetical protein